MLSILILAIATFLLFSEQVNQNDWKIVLIAISVSYVGSMAIIKSKKVTVPIVAKSFWARLKALFSREYVISITVLMIASIVCYLDKIDSATWVSIASTVGGSYNIFNGMIKK